MNFLFFFLLSDMTFTHEGNKTFIDGLVNFEKMVSMLLVYMQYYLYTITFLKLIFIFYYSVFI